MFGQRINGRSIDRKTTDLKGGTKMNDHPEFLKRREFLMKSGLLALAAGPAVAVAATDSDAHQHGGTGEYAAMLAEALHCIETGNACGAHCIDDMRSGSTELLDCLLRVQELVIACEALSKLSAYGSDHVKTYAAATVEVCDTCEAECRKFESKHAECKECADACVACRTECQKVLGTA
jgi:Cys-rich four helix bundle protein (predicted Tat secretion target)